MTIRILDEQLANQIAAGEVIERPASVVKELVENALDAGATEVEVVVEEAGRKLIQVTDNGSGMSREDAVISLQRHATSKIATTEDLFSIRTLGFRGEALPSIAAVSHLRLITRLHSENAGTELEVRGGNVLDLREVGCPPGTQIQVASLFYNTPARLKFLKSDQTESGQIADLLNTFALCHHMVNFRLLHNGREVLARPATARMLPQISAWLGRKAAEAMAPVEFQAPNIRIEGHVGKPEVCRGNRTAQLFFVNGRRIVNRALTHALDYGFEGLLPPKQYPVGVLKITVDPELVDVNVHPAKAEVRFHRESEMHSAVVRAVKSALGGVSLVQELDTWQPSAGALSRPVSRPVSEGPATLPTLDLPATSLSAPVILTTPGAPPPMVGLRAVGQFHGIYLIAEGRDALLIINQHRAHERVIFDKLMAGFARVEVQRLVLPATIHLGHREAALLLEHLEDLAGCGFEVEPMSGQSFLVRAQPALLATRDPEGTLREILADLEAGISIAPFTCEDPAQRALQESRRRLMASVACKGAVKAGKLLAPDEQQRLLDELQATKQSSLCPHGGAIIMTVTRYELDKKFVR